MMRTVILLASFLICTSSLWGQRFKFTPDRDTYPEQLKTYFKDLREVNKEEEEAVMLSFSGVWNSAGITDSEADEVFKISNNFLKKRVSNFQDWKWFLEVLMHIETNENEEYLLLWLQDMEQFSNEEPAKFISNYIRTMYGAFFNYELFNDGRIKWSIASGDYTFSFEDQPKFSFDGVDIWGHYKEDSTRIEGTGGVYYPKSYTFKGNGGYAYFVRAGLTEDSASVELKNFILNTSKTDFEADSVILRTQIYLTEPTMGKFEEKLTSAGGRGGGTFPRFTSYDKNIVLKDVVPGANFVGGFSVIGSRFYGTGSDTSNARFTFNYNDKELISAESDRFLMRQDKIFSEDVLVKIFLDEDSIYHPKVTLRFLPESQQLSILRESEGLGQTPFTDSYHNVDMAFEILTWNVGETQMKLGNLNLGAESAVIFESKNYYRGSRFEQLRGLDNESPLFRIKKMTDAYGKRTLTAKEVGHFMRMDEKNAHIFMMQMSVYGFVRYDLNKRTGYFKDKVYEYLLNFQKKRDYDVIQFVSNLSQGSNATISLEDFDMEISGITTMALSDSQKVRLFPRDRKINLHKDLNFDFDGKITAGRFSYWGELFEFNYDAFRINMENIDSMRFKVNSFEENALGQRELVDVKTVLEGLTGELLIDDPNNKSGQKIYTEYPIFKSAKDSYIYYDKPTIFSGVYNRSNFYVTLEPFTIDSLDNITTEGLFFEGDFTSAGIFPEMAQTIKVQPDYSLGFVTETPPEGLSAYGGKGTFNNTISLSNEGLRGDGDIKYLNSLATSDEFFFFPDSTNGIAQSYEITAQVTEPPSTPHAVGDNVFLHWEPYNDVLYITSKETPFAMYDDVGMKATGTLAHRPKTLNGKGLLEFYNAETRADDYLFKHRDFSSNDLAFRVRANPEMDWGFSMENANGKVDFDKQKGDFYLNNPADYFTFPANQYICYMDYAQWQIPEKAIDVEKKGAEASSLMISTNSMQDSLQFVAEKTKFYLEDVLLESFGVPNIDVADASIFPDTGYVAIDEKADMRTLTNAAITANRETKLHEFYGGTIDIYSRGKYNGSADYEYLDQDNTPWPIHFETIKVDTAGRTIGLANVKQSEGFYMSPYFAYYGNVALTADQKALDFNGYTHIIAECNAISTDWFGFKSTIDPDSIVIDLPDIDADDKTKVLGNGVYLRSDTISGYAAFLSKNVPVNDKQMFFTTGKLFFDEGKGSYVIVNEEQLNDAEAKGNYLALNTTACKMHGEGEMSIGDNKSQMDVGSWGNIDYNLENDEMILDLVMALDFHFSDDIQKAMATTINKVTLLPASDLTRPTFKIAAKELLKPKDMDEFYEDVANYGAPEKLPQEFQHTILLSEVKMEWVPEAIGFLSKGQIALGALGKYPVNKKMFGLMEINRKRNGDEIYLYLEVDRNTFFYFEYKRNQLIFYSSEEDLMNMIKGLDLKDRRSEEKGKPIFTYTIGTAGKMKRFIDRYSKYE